MSKNKITLEGFQFDGAARLPQYVELLRRESWVKYGENNNLYGAYQVYYQNVPIHRSCLQAKIFGIQGKSLTTKDPAHADLLMFANPNEDIYSLYKKMVKDYVVLGSFGLQVIRSKDGGVSHYYHTPIDKWRSGKAGEDDVVRDYYFSEQWERYREPRYVPQRVAYFSMENTEDARQFYYYKDYEPTGQFYYGYPSYISAVPSLQLATEIINHHLTSVQNSMTPSMALSLVGEIPPAEERQNILDKLKMLYGGTNGQKFFLNFIESNEQKPQVDVIQPTTTDGLYENIDKLVTQNIITAHQITSPLLLGIRESGTSGLGNNKDEILISYNHFINTSCKPVQRVLLDELERLIFLKTKVKVELVLEQNPILDIEELPTDAGTATKPGEIKSTTPNPGSETEMSINQNIKGMSGREWQNMMRVVREYNKSKLSYQQAKQILMSGYGLSNEDVNVWLGEEEIENETI